MARTRNRSRLTLPPSRAGLTEMLRGAGALPGGSVDQVEIDLKIETSVSNLCFLTVRYSADAPALPAHLVVKWSPDGAKSNPADSLNPAITREISFYANLAPSLPSPPVVRCVAFAPATEPTPWLVLEDLRGTHTNPPWPLPPSRENISHAVAALARIHAEWWESPTLGVSVGEPHTAESLISMVSGIAGGLPGFLDALGDAVPSVTRAILERVFSSSLSPWLRLVDPRGLTVAHGDAHTWNFLFPRSGAGPTYLIDWQTWHLDIGARDLAFMMALHWYPELRREVEEPLIKQYHCQLMEHGVTAYSFDDLWLDYRRCAIRNLTFPIILWSRGFRPEAWWHRLECAVAAFHDLHCEEVI